MRGLIDIVLKMVQNVEGDLDDLCLIHSFVLTKGLVQQSCRCANPVITLLTWKPARVRRVDELRVIGRYVEAWRSNLCQVTGQHLGQTVEVHHPIVHRG